MSASSDLALLKCGVIFNLVAINYAQAYSANIVDLVNIAEKPVSCIAV